VSWLHPTLTILATRQQLNREHKFSNVLLNFQGISCLYHPKLREVSIETLYCFNITTEILKIKRWNYMFFPIILRQSLLLLRMCIDTMQTIFSANGIAYCAYSASVGSNYYVTVVNTDTTVDFSSTFRFTCYVSSFLIPNDYLNVK
jgi:hypothetical protein